MARGNPIDAGLKKLTVIQDDPSSAEGVKLLREALKKGRGMVVEKAVRLIEQVAFGCEDAADRDPSLREEMLDEKWVRMFQPLLEETYGRLLAEPGKDVKAFGKIAILRFFNRADYGNAGPFLEGVGYRQFEPVMGGQVDCAPPIRAESLMGLVRLRHPDRFRRLTEMLWDDCQDARIGAVRAAVYEGAEITEMILMAKAYGGDKGDDFPAPYPDHDGGAAVFGEIFSGLLELGGDANVTFVATFLQSGEHTGQVREQAAMALGESRLSSGLRVLADAWESAVEIEERERILFAAALNGTDKAMEIISGWIAEAPARMAESYKEVLHSIYDPSNPRLARLFPQ